MKCNVYDVQIISSAPCERNLAPQAENCGFRRWGLTVIG